MSRRKPKPRPAVPTPTATALPPLGTPAADRRVFEARRRCLVGEADCDGGRSSRELFAAWAGLNASAPIDLAEQAPPEIAAAWQLAWHRALRDLLSPRRVLA